MTRKIESYSLIPKHNDYTSAFRRIKKMNINIEHYKISRISTATDGSGIKINSAGEYRKDKYGDTGDKKYLRVVITADPF